MKGLLGRQSTFVRNSVRDVEDMAEISMERHRAHVERNREAAAQRLSIRILERKGEMDPSRAQAQRKNLGIKINPVTPRPSSALAHEQALLTVNRVQIEARRASQVHARKVEQQRINSDKKLSQRLMARNKVKRTLCLQACPAFGSLDNASANEIVDVMEYATAETGETLCTEGDVADKMFIIVSGMCSVSVAGTRVATLRELDVFGEMALFPGVSGSPLRSATVTVIGAAGVELLVLGKSSLESAKSSGLLTNECLDVLAHVAESRRLANEKGQKA